MKIYKKGFNYNSDCDYKISFASLNKFFYENKNKQEKKLFKIDEEIIKSGLKKLAQKIEGWFNLSGSLHGVNEPYRS